jgi:hypothetical protein
LFCAAPLEFTLAPARDCHRTRRTVNPAAAPATFSQKPVDGLENGYIIKS